MPVCSQFLLTSPFLVTSLEILYNITNVFQGPDISHMVMLASKETGKCVVCFLNLGTLPS